MTNLNLFSGSNEQTMSSRDIATLTGKRHADVLADVRNMLNALGIKQNDFSVLIIHGAPIRDLISITQLGFVQMLELRAQQSLQYGMDQNLPYKFIYKYAKEEVNTLADSLNFRGGLKE